MRRLLPLYGIVMALACAPGAARADDMEGWCAQAKKASSIVICSDAELRRQAIARNKLFEAAHAKLSPEAYKALIEDQSRWIKAYTARCGVSIDDPPPPLPIPPTIIECYQRESRARTAYLAASLSEPNPTASLPPARSAPAPSPSAAATAPTQAPPDNSRTEEVVKDALVRAGIPRAEVEAQAAWEDCTDAAVDHFADQAELARTIAEAAIATCEVAEIRCAEEAVKDAIMQQAGATLIGMQHSIETATTPRLLARVMAIRAARAKLRQENPQTTPAIDYNHM
jgi:uncharacterized protein YecT (DUF1311 family)